MPALETPYCPKFTLPTKLSCKIFPEHSTTVKSRAINDYGFVFTGNLGQPNSS